MSFYPFPAFPAGPSWQELLYGFIEELDALAVCAGPPKHLKPAIDAGAYFELRARYRDHEHRLLATMWHTIANLPEWPAPGIGPAAPWRSL